MNHNLENINNKLEELFNPKKQGKKSESNLMNFSFIFFSDMNDDNQEKYEHLFEVAAFADKNRFQAIWLPERHFHSFGGSYPNPAILASALAVKTKHVRLRSGSIVLPIHHPIEIVESWSMIDHLSNGRVDLGFASGWNPNDFILSPTNYSERRKIWYERIHEVKRLWSGQQVAFTNGIKKEVEVQTFPTPLQKEIEVWLAITKLDESFYYAGSKGYNILTMLQGIDLDELGNKIKIYKDARAAHGFSAESGKVTLMLHTLVNENKTIVESAVKEPFLKYIRSALSGHAQSMKDHQKPSEAEMNKIVEYSYERYFNHGALFGSINDTEKVVHKAYSVGVTEIACLIDFGVKKPLVIESLQYLNKLKNRFEGK
jgi:natural product biosynthesis luciferase-like monooxygenase protein